MAKKSCKKGYYYCYASKKCKKIPMGYYVSGGGWLRKDEEKDETESKKKNGNGNGSNGDGSGSGDSNGGSNGGGVSEGWSAKYKKSIDCDNPKGFSQRAHCQGRKKVNEEKKEGCDHEVVMARKQVKKSMDNLKKLARVLAKKSECEDLPAWVQAKITDTEHNTDAAASYMSEGRRDGKRSGDKGYSLRDWFKGGGWVQVSGKYKGKPCAKQPGQKTKPFCRDADDAASMSKKEKDRRTAKKRREDPNPNREGKAKMVTASYSNWRAELEQLDEVAPLVVAAGVGALAAAPYLAKKFLKPKVDKALDNATKTNRIPLATGGTQADLRKAKGLNNSFEPEGELVDEGKKKDACYYKVKSRYSVWPSAYASGALVKCRKVGAKNWGNKTKKEGYEFSNWRDDFQAMEFQSVDIIKAEPLQPTKGIGSDMLGEAKKCWKGYEKKGTQKLFGKTYNRCVKKESFSNWREELSEEGVDVLKDKRRGSEPKPKPEPKSTYGLKGIGPTLQGQIKLANSHKPEGELIEDWQKSNRKDGVDGMSQKSVNAYRRENPGSKLQTAVTEKKPKGKRAKRRKSFCARSKGQKDMHNIDCSKTPEKKICKARKRWRC